MRRFALIPALGLLLAATPAAAAVIGTTGAIFEIAAPASTLEGALDSNTQIFLFAEQASVTLGSALAVNLDTPGTYDNNNLPPGGGPVAAGTLVDSYFVHYNPASGNQSLFGSVTFDTDILGVLVFTAALEGSDASLGSPGTVYIPLGGDANRGLDFGPDAVTLSADLRTLSFALSDNSNRVDQARIVVAGAGSIVPEPDTALLFGAGLLVLAAARRK